MTEKMDKFADIRPYNDNEVAQSVERLLNDDGFISVIAEHNLPNWLRAVPFLGKFLVKAKLRKTYGQFTSVDEVQQAVARYLQILVERTTTKVTFSGLDKLDKSKAYLFISNHRDIALDPAFVNYGLFQSDMNTVRIAIGDNLLQVPYMTELMRLNKSFIVKRSVKSPKEMLRTLSTLSHYIFDSIDTGNSVWIAQKEGRAKDGNDVTDPALIKMIQLHGRKQKMDFADYVAQLNIVPVAISYEFEPCEKAKANEQYHKAKFGEYLKAEGEDIQSIIDGFATNKGHVHLCFGKPITNGCDTPDQLAHTNDEHIHANYNLHPNNYLAANKNHDEISPAEQAAYKNRFDDVSPELHEFIEQIYAKPALNQK
jgi:1-acyl-sn-glycerol-3-phosphate acyltransferase